jgi:simple sugar transport system substrate-binding protein
MTVVKEVLAGKEQPKWVKTQEGVFPMETAAKEFPSRKY